MKKPPTKPPTPPPAPPPADEEPSSDRGIECANCGCRHFYVYRTIPVVNGILRIRECRHCGRKHRSIERVLGGENQKGATGSA